MNGTYHIGFTTEYLVLTFLYLTTISAIYYFAFRTCVFLDILFVYYGPLATIYYIYRSVDKSLSLIPRQKESNKYSLGASKFEVNLWWIEPLFFNLTRFIVNKVWHNWHNSKYNHILKYLICNLYMIKPFWIFIKI